MKQLRNSTIEALDQLEQLITLAAKYQDGEFYNQAPEHVMSGIGKHVRHILDHFLAFQQGIISGCVDYNLRHRDSRIEDDHKLAKQLVLELRNWLMDTELEDANIEIESEVSVQSEVNQRFRSSVSRELCYLINHSVHHIAYATLLAQSLGMIVNPKLGVAPSTASYLRQQK
ncbi:hypothetical protein DBZ36_16755 [Alginatibacterium sediminis]|uniref:DinB family protein n=1 Tax=Alginatibacterium sediminis TaxID=2164068 RepID=A0A420E6Y4_9ALTE|nr:DinB family protein [Alginatibacterium sediminis]RKF14312.1 hypothetical protein DBZ36_16755 [Alginatibacterium sediminis]